jgi:hypothetical protein
MLGGAIALLRASNAAVALSLLALVSAWPI